MGTIEGSSLSPDTVAQSEVLWIEIVSFLALPKTLHAPSIMIVSSPWPPQIVPVFMAIVRCFVTPCKAPSQPVNKIAIKPADGGVPGRLVR